MDNLQIRPATSADFDRISAILNDPPNQTALTIAGSVERALRAGRLFVREGLSVQLAHTVVAESGGAVIGIMDASPARNETEITPRLVVRLLPLMIREAGPVPVWRFLRSRPAWARVGFAPDPADYYIAELDVDPAMRNRGVGAVLLAHGETAARAKRCPRMSLTTDIINPAQHLYERTGFHVVETKMDAAYERISGSPGRVRMVKHLE